MLLASCTATRSIDNNSKIDLFAIVQVPLSANSADIEKKFGVADSKIRIAKNNQNYWVWNYKSHNFPKQISAIFYFNNESTLVSKSYAFDQTQEHHTPSQLVSILSLNKLRSFKEPQCGNEYNSSVIYHIDDESGVTLTTTANSKNVGIVTWELKKQRYPAAINKSNFCSQRYSVKTI